MPIRLAPLALALLFSPLGASAQAISIDASGAPRQGTLRASSSTQGVLDLQIAPEAENPVRGCAGYITLGAPDAVVDWSGGGGPLRVWMRSALDGVMVLKTPMGETLCEDDTDGVQPAIEIGQAHAGRYAVWVGAFSRTIDASPAATLYAGPPPPEVSLGEPDVSTPSTVIMGPLDSPSEESVTAGGSHAAASLGMPISCAGFFDPMPTLRFSAQAPYFLTTDSDADLAFAIRTPDGEWLCDDDSGDGKNPAIEITNSMGQHVIWVGTFRGFARGDAPEATLITSAEAPDEYRMASFPVVPAPPPPPERVYFSRGTFTPLNLDSPGERMPLAANADRAEFGVLARGEIGTPVSGDACVGFLPAMASATVAFEGAGPLTLTAESSSSDLVMAARTASGEWYCSDDASGQDPAIEIATPGGDVLVWVGTFGQSDGAAATLAAHRAELSDVLPEESAIYDEYIEVLEGGGVSYSEGSYSGSGLTPEATAAALSLGVESSVSAGGTVPNPVRGDACVGFIAAAPSAAVTASGGTLSFAASGDEDLTMTVRTPNGRWFCSDDHVGLDPGVEVSSGGDGVYAIWLGTFASLERPSSARLIVREGPLSPSR